jgi:hypothetical protein
VNRGDAYKLLAVRLNELRNADFEALLARVGQPPTSDILEINGESIVVAIEVLWAKQVNGPLRVRATAFGPSTWMTERLEESFIVAAK